MFIGKYELDNQVYFNLYFSWEQWHTDTFSPNCENIEILEFRLNGETYQEKKESLRELAIEYQSRFTQYCWSYAELAHIGHYFYTNGRRYGLLKEFRENAIC
jgi:hypothetical protein